MPALTVSVRAGSGAGHRHRRSPSRTRSKRSEEHTSELQSRFDLVCRLLLEKKKKDKKRVKHSESRNKHADTSAPPQANRLGITNGSLITRHDAVELLTGRCRARQLSSPHAR